MPRANVLLSFFALTTYVSANTYGSANSNWGAPSSIKQSAPGQVKNQCSGSGSFITEYLGAPLCSSYQTHTTPPEGVTCPLSWGFHKTAECCVPETEVQPCDCGEASSFEPSTKKCVRNQPQKCSSSEWWHDRSGTCCDNSWSWNPPKGSCPPGKSCPHDWFWHDGHKCCKPKHKRSPAPGCDNWNQNEQSCGTGHDPTPSHGSKPPGGGGWYGKKRDFNARQQAAVVFPQSDLDAMYCPGKLHACSIITPGGGEWAYECIDFATELESCGGCVSMGQGVDCMAIPHAASVGCESGSCAVYSCKTGFSANGTACVSR